MRPGWLIAVTCGCWVAVAGGCGGGGHVAGSIPVQTIAQPSRTVTYGIPSSSMEPTLHCEEPAPGCGAVHRDGVVVREPPGTLERGDVVVFRTPQTAAERCGAGGLFVMRIVGLGGETISERDGFVYVNSKMLDEPYVTPDRRDRLPPRTWRVPEASYFLMGDNRAQACDSRVWGSVPGSSIIGKVVRILRTG